VYDAAEGLAVAEVAAHSRPVSAIAVHPTKPWVVTAGEDTFVHVWHVSALQGQRFGSAFAGEEAVLLLFSGRGQNLHDDAVLTGVAWDGDRILATAHDEAAMLTWDPIP